MDEDEVRPDERDDRLRVEALDTLRAWLLIEDSHARGGVPDEALHFIQDHLGRLFGPRAEVTAADVLRRRLEPGAGLADLARDRSFLLELEARIEEKRRPGFEQQWRADGGEPRALLVMAEYGVGDPVWDRPHGHGGPVSVGELGVSEALGQRLREWNEQYERLALTDFEWESPETGAAWVQRGLYLAHELQRELPDVDVRYFHADDDRVLRSL